MLTLAVSLVSAASCGDDEPDAAGPAPRPSATVSDESSSNDPEIAAPTSLTGDTAIPACASTGGCTVGPDGVVVDASATTTTVPAETTSSVVVASVRTVDVGGWGALGLVTSGGADAPGGVIVTATLADAGGAALGTIEQRSLVAPVRTGESVPFRLASDVPAGSVASVTWSTRTADAPVAGSGRALVVATYWTRPASGEPVAVIGYEDVAGAPLAHVVYGGASNPSAEAVAEPRVVAAWIGTDGRVLAVADAPVFDAGTDRPASSLSSGDAGDVVLVVADPSVAAQLEARSPMMWGAGS